MSDRRAPIRVLVCGGRDYAATEPERLLMLQTLASIHRRRRFSLIIEGGATGADTGARIFGDVAGIPVSTFKANWLKHGRAAGPIRNQQMLDEGKPDLVVAFPGGRGTADMVRRAREAGVEVMEVTR